MHPISMVDLKSQYIKIKPEVDKAIHEVIDSTQFIKGKVVSDFENNLAEYLNVNHVIACGNGTDALQVALMALDLKPGDEVITANFTFIATVEVISLLGLKPILVDVDPDTFNIDIEGIKNAITTKTKAIIPVHLFGQCSNMEAIMKIAEQHKLFVIEDNAQAIGSHITFSNGSKKMAGTIGHIGCTSFFPSKNLGCFGDGGAIFTNDASLAAKIASIINHGMQVRYYHDRIGINSRLDSIQAAVLNVKLPHLKNYIGARQEVAHFYNRAFAKCNSVQTPAVANFTDHVYHQYTLKILDGRRNELKKWLEGFGIPAMIYYPVPLHRQKAFVDFKEAEKEFEVTDRLVDEVISLPMHTELDEEQLKHITQKVLEFFKK